MHLNFDDAIALTGFAATALYIEREAPRFVSACFGFRKLRIPLPDGSERTSIGGRIGAGSSADWGLINVNDLIKMFESLNIIKFSGHSFGVHQLARRCLIEGLDS